MSLHHTCNNLDSIANCVIVHKAYQLAASNAAYILRELVAALGDGTQPINAGRLSGTLSGIVNRPVEVREYPEPAPLPVAQPPVVAPAIFPDAAHQAAEHRAALSYLASHNGAVLYWQVPTGMDALLTRAYAAGAVRLNAHDDCYVHPAALVNLVDGSYSMPPVKA